MHPATWFLVGAFFIPVFKRMGLTKVILIAVPLIACLQIQWLPESFGHASYLGFDLVFGKVDQLTRVFLHVFTIMALIGCIYGLHVKETGQHIAAFLYVAGSLGVTLCGDYVTLFIAYGRSINLPDLVSEKESIDPSRIQIPAGSHNRRVDPSGWYFSAV